MSRPAARFEDWADDFEGDEAQYDAPSRQAVARVLPGARPATGAGPAAAPESARRRRIRWGQLAAVTLVGYLVVVGASSEFTLLGVSRQASSLSAQAATLATENQALRHQVTLLHQRRYVDELARTELGYVSPGEVELVPTKAAHTAAHARA